MSPMLPATLVRGGSASSHFRHPQMQLRQLTDRGAGYVATGLLKRGELLLEEQPFLWDTGKKDEPDLQEGAAWMLASGLAHELNDELELSTASMDACIDLAQRYAFRTHRPCSDGSYPGMLFRSCCRFNHSCFPNAGGHLPGGEDFPSVSKYPTPSLRIYALEEIREGEEICISYLSESDQLSPLKHRRALLEGWGFICRCDRCCGGRPLDRRLEAMEGMDSEKKTALAAVNKAFRSLFDASFEGYNPPGDFETTVERLNNFRKDFGFLDKAHIYSQRIRRELIATFLLGGFDSDIARRCAGPALSLLVEEMHVQDALLPSLSPCKVTPYLQFLYLLRYVPEKEAQWHVSDLKVDGCELQHQQSLWLHDQPAAKRLGLAQPRNLPAPPVIGAPLRTGPSAKPGAACAPGPCSVLSEQQCSQCRWGWPRGCRRSEINEMPPLVEAKNREPQPECSSLWDAYADFGRPSKDAQKLRGTKGTKVRESKGKAGESWFKFRVAR